MIRGMAIASRALGRADLAESATAALRFIHSKLWSNGKLLATYKDGHAHLNAYVDDYVFLVDAILELQQTRFNSAELKFAGELLEVVLAHFVDADAGGFFFTSDDHETLIYRSKSFADDATPSGNGIAAFVLQRMGHLFGEPRYLQAAERTLRAAWLSIEKYPHAHTTLLSALEELSHPPETIILRGDKSQITTWAQELHKLFAPRRMVLAVPTIPRVCRLHCRKTVRGQSSRLRMSRQHVLGSHRLSKRTGESPARRYSVYGCSSALPSRPTTVAKPIRAPPAPGSRATRRPTPNPAEWQSCRTEPVAHPGRLRNSPPRAHNHW